MLRPLSWVHIFSSAASTRTLSRRSKRKRIKSGNILNKKKNWMKTRGRKRIEVEGR
jgi:hypothetical protein